MKNWGSRRHRPLDPLAGGQSRGKISSLDSYIFRLLSSRGIWVPKPRTFGSMAPRCHGLCPAWPAAAEPPPLGQRAPHGSLVGLEACPLDVPSSLPESQSPASGCTTSACCLPRSSNSPPFKAGFRLQVVTRFRADDASPGVQWTPGFGGGVKKIGRFLA